MSPPKKQWNNEVLVGMLIVAAILVGYYLSLKVGGFRGMSDSIRIVVVLDDAAGLKKDLVVKVAGIDVGRITALEVDFDKARIHASLEKSAEIRNDVLPFVRAKSLLGEKYLSLRPVSPDAPLLVDGDVIVGTSVPIESDQLFNQVGRLLQTIPPEDVRKFVDSIGDFWGAHESRLESILVHVDELLTAGVEVKRNQGERLDRLATELETTLTMAREILEPVHARKEDVGLLIERLSRLTDTLDRKLPGLLEGSGNLVTHADGAIVKMDPVLDDLPPLIEDLRSLTQRLSPLLGKLEAIDAESIKYTLRDQGVKIHIGNIVGE